MRREDKREKPEFGILVPAAWCAENKAASLSAKGRD